MRSLRGELVYYELQKRQLPELTETDLQQNAFLIPSPEACRYRYADVGSFLEARTDICAGDEVTVRIEAGIEGRTPAPYWMEQGAYTFVIGDERLVPGLAESLIGHTLGDQVVYDWVVPAGYGTDASLEGKTVTFYMEVTAHQGRSYVEDMTVPVEEEMLADYEALQGYIQ